MATEVKRQKKNFGSEVYAAYKSGKYPFGQNRSNGNVFFDRNTIYSYGYHFKMAIRMQEEGEAPWYLVNADVYSNTTARHQAELRQALRYETTVTIPFSALDRANIAFDTIELVDQQPERLIPYRYKDSKTGEWREGKQHLMGSSVIRAKFWTGSEGKHTYFLSGLDETAKNVWRSFFLSQLPHEVTTVENAYESLKPREVQSAEWNGREVLRQGEWFFVRVNDELAKQCTKFEKLWEKNKPEYLINRDTSRPAQHLVTRKIAMPSGVAVRGTCRHTGGDHKLLKFEKGAWYFAFENTQVAGWGASGRID